MNKTIQGSFLFHIVAVDVILITVAILLPVVSHVFGIGVRFLEPMRLSLLAAILIIPERKNAYIMAILLPWLSFAIAGMPVLWKAALMSLELLVNVYVFYRLVDWKINATLSVVISIILAKTIYYIIKYLLIYFAIIPNVELVGSVPMMFISIVLLSILFGAGTKIINQ